MKPLPVVSSELEVNDLLVTDMTFAGELRSREHDHELPFVGIVLNGSLEKWIGRMSFGMGTAGAYVMPAGTRHVDGYPAGVRLLTLEIDVESEMWEPSAGLLSRLRRLRGPGLATLGRQIALELKAQDEARMLAIEGLSLELVAAAMRSLAGANERPKAPAWLNTVDAFLNESFCRPLRIADIASEVHVHPAHLARVFRTHHGETIGNRIRRLRLDWALGQLVEGELPLRDIATRAGFAHQSHFTRAFKEYTGSPPAEYRARHRVTRIDDRRKPELPLRACPQVNVAAC